MDASQFQTEMKAERNRLGLTQERMAFLIGKSTRTYAGWEAGQSVEPAIMMEGLIAMLRKMPTGRKSA